jgi:predicted kinase
METARVILVTGLPGTGKTTLARKLAKRYALPFIAKDAIKEPLLDVVGATDAAQSRRLSDASFAVMFNLARDLCAGGASVLLEGNFRPGEHEHALSQVLAPRAAEPHTVSVCQILCTCDESERLARLARRRGDASRHAGHRDIDLVSAPPAPRGATFLDMQGARLIYDGADDRTLLAEFEHWWNSRTIS